MPKRAWGTSSHLQCAFLSFQSVDKISSTKIVCTEHMPGERLVFRRGPPELGVPGRRLASIKSSSRDQNGARTQLAYQMNLESAGTSVAVETIGRKRQGRQDPSPWWHCHASGSKVSAPLIQFEHVPRPGNGLLWLEKHLPPSGLPVLTPWPMTDWAAGYDGSPVAWNI